MLSISTSPGSRGTISVKPLHFRLEYRMHCHCHLETTERIAFREFGPRPISLTHGFLLTFSCACLDRQPLLGDNHHCSDDEFSMPTNNPGWGRGSHFPPLAGLAGMYKIFSRIPGSVCCLFRPCSLCSGVFPSLPMSHLFIRNAANSTSQQSILSSGGTLVPMRRPSAAFSVLARPATSPTARSMIPSD